MEEKESYIYHVHFKWDNGINQSGDGDRTLFLTSDINTEEMLNSVREYLKKERNAQSIVLCNWHFLGMGKPKPKEEKKDENFVTFQYDECITIIDDDGTDIGHADLQEPLEIIDMFKSIFETLGIEVRKTNPL